MKIIIIGSGPGGYEAAIRGAQLGAEVTLIEKSILGGTCLNVGCIPTKVMYKHASLIQEIKTAHEHGLKVSLDSIDFDKMNQIKRETTLHLRHGVKALIEGNHINYIEGCAQLIDSTTVLVEKDNLTTYIKGDYIILATGSHPITPPISGIEHTINSSQLLNIDQIPKSLTIVGGGVVGVEFAGIFNALGSQVTLIEAKKNILSFLDTDVSKRLANQMKKSGITILTDTMVESFSKNHDIEINCIKKNKNINIKSEVVLMAVGRKANLIQGLDNLKIKYNNAIDVDENYRTSLKNIYAIGDVNGINMLAHAASHQGHQVMEHIINGVNLEEKSVIPSCIFSFPEVSSVGETEASLKKAGIEYKSSKFSFQHNGKAMTIKETNGFIKVLSVDNRLVGVQIIGPHASDLIAEATLGIQNRLTTFDYINTIHPHPTLSETFLEAIRGLHEMAIHQTPLKSVNRKQII